ncbi:hypothetical protein OIE99_21360 [Streptomyces cellulosae]|nr:hypothetical protein OIE99_21360 [Streptomyces cellulosae]
MGKRRLALCAGVLAVTAFGPAACAAYAADGGGVSVVPAAPVPGADVALKVTGCDAREAVAQSPALVSDARLTPDGDGLTGDGRVRSTLTAGTYTVTVACDGTEHKGTVEVVRKRTPAAAAGPSAQPSPVAPVNAGAGGAARELVGGPEPHGPGTAQTVVALALAGTAALTVHRAARRQARSGRGTV